MSNFKPGDRVRCVGGRGGEPVLEIGSEHVVGEDGTVNGWWVGMPPALHEWELVTEPRETRFDEDPGLTWLRERVANMSASGVSTQQEGDILGSLAAAYGKKIVPSTTWRLEDA